jgi:hypothetical protein
MDKLKQNPFLAAMGVLAVVAVVAFIILVMPAQSVAGKKTTEIQNQVKTINKEIADLPGKQNLEVWSAAAAALKTRYQDRLKEMMELDQNLGEWFTDLDDNSTYQVFMNQYGDQTDKLQKELIEKGVLLGSPKADDAGKLTETGVPGFNWIQPNEIKAPMTEDERAAKVILQTRFNISRAIVNAVTSGTFKPGTRRLLDVTFLERFKYSTTTVASTDKGASSIPIDLKRYAGHTGVGSGNYVEWFLPRNGETPPPPPAEAEAGTKPGDAAPAPAAKAPDKDPHLGKTITFGFAVVMDYNQVPDLLRNLIASPVPPQLNLSIVGVNIFVAEPNPTEIKELRLLDPGQLTQEMKETLKKEEETREAAYQPPQVHVYVTCQVFDLEPAAVPAFLRP